MKRWALFWYSLVWFSQQNKKILVYLCKGTIQSQSCVTCHSNSHCHSPFLCHPSQNSPVVQNQPTSHVADHVSAISIQMATYSNVQYCTVPMFGVGVHILELLHGSTTNPYHQLLNSRNAQSTRDLIIYQPTHPPLEADAESPPPPDAKSGVSTASCLVRQGTRCVYESESF